MRTAVPEAGAVQELVKQVPATRQEGLSLDELQVTKQ